MIKFSLQTLHLQHLAKSILFYLIWDIICCKETIRLFSLLFVSWKRWICLDFFLSVSFTNINILLALRGVATSHRLISEIYRASANRCCFIGVTDSGILNCRVSGYGVTDSGISNCRVSGSPVSGLWSISFSSWSSSLFSE